MLQLQSVILWLVPVDVELVTLQKFNWLNSFRSLHPLSTNDGRPPVKNKNYHCEKSYVSFDTNGAHEMLLIKKL